MTSHSLAAKLDFLRTLGEIEGIGQRDGMAGVLACDELHHISLVITRMVAESQGAYISLDSIMTEVLKSTPQP